MTVTCLHYGLPRLTPSSVDGERPGERLVVRVVDRDEEAPASLGHGQLRPGLDQAAAAGPGSDGGLRQHPLGQGSGLGDTGPTGVGGEDPSGDLHRAKGLGGGPVRKADQEERAGDPKPHPSTGRRLRGLALDRAGRARPAARAFDRDPQREYPSVLLLTGYPAAAGFWIRCRPS